jgi:hypothetical protein
MCLRVVGNICFVGLRDGCVAAWDAPSATLLWRRKLLDARDPPRRIDVAGSHMWLLSRFGTLVKFRFLPPPGSKLEEALAAL